MRVSLTAAVVCCMFLVGCQAPEVEVTPNWDEPLVGGTEVEGTREAAKLLRFPPVIAEDLGSPLRILVDERRNRLGKTMALVYDHPSHGLFNVLQGTSPMTQVDLESLAERCDPAFECSGDWEKVALAPGVVGVQIQGQVANSVIWKVGHIRFDVLGPAETFAPDASMEVARTMLAASQPG